MCRWLLILLLFPMLWVQADERADKLAKEGLAEFNAAYQAWDGARFGVAADLFRQASVQAPTSSTYFYWLGAAQFHRLLQLQSLPVTRSNKLAADTALDGAIDALNRAVELEPRHAESHALLGTLFGMKIDGNIFRAALLGPRLSKHLKLALELGPENPRVSYLVGTCQFYTAKKPAAQREALASFLAAEKLFAKEAQRPAEPLEPRWGYSSCLVFIGRTYEALGQKADAVHFFRQALAQHPTNHAAQEALARLTPNK